MNILILILATLFSTSAGTPLEKASHGGSADDGLACITASKITKSILSWKILKTEMTFNEDKPFLEISVHNPLNRKTPESIDAKFVLSVDPKNAQNYNLELAVYYNGKTNVTF